MSFLLEIDNLDEVRDILWDIDPRLNRTMTAAFRGVAQVAKDDSQRALSSVKSELNLQRGVGSTARQTYAALKIRSTSDRPTIAAVLGANIHPVYGRNYPARVLQGKRPWMQHLGASWQPEDLYVIGPVLTGRTMDEVVDIFWEAWTEALDGLAEVSR